MHKTLEELQSIWEETFASSIGKVEVSGTMEVEFNLDNMKRVFSPQPLNLRMVAKPRSPKIVKKAYAKILLVPDAHVTTDQDLTRFDRTRELIEDKKPDIILLGGDFADILSLNFFDKNNKLAVEGRRYKHEIEAVNDALDRLLSFKKDDGYNPRLIYLEGNHEYRVQRYVEVYSQLSGHMQIEDDLKLSQRGFEFVPYKKIIEIEKILFCHAIMNAVSSPVGGKFATQKAGDLTSKSLVFFHSHQSASSIALRHGDDELIQIYNGGCFYPGAAPGGYSEDSSHGETKCLSMLTIYKPGRFDVEQISLDRVMEKAW